MNRTIVVVFAAVLATFGGCSFDPAAVTDTGYIGTWTRGNDRIRSQIAIAKVGEEYRVRWKKRTQDGRLKVVCDWGGACEEFLDGKKIADYRFRAWRNSAEGNLFLEVVETRTVPVDFKQRYTDELVVTDGGKILWSYTVEKNGDKFEFGKGPQRSFDKLFDAVANPPRS